MKVKRQTWRSVRDALLGRVQGSNLWQQGCVWLDRNLADSKRRNFLILSAARSGSTLLVNYLNCSRKICCHGEILNSGCKIYGSVEGKSRERLRLHVESFYRQRGARCVGAKFHTHQFEEVSLPFGDVLELLQRPKVIVLYRENLLESYVSLQIARRNNVWYSDSIVNDDSIEVDWQAFLRYAASERARWEACLAAVTGFCETHALTFEQMLANPQEALSGVFAFLGVPSAPVATRTVRQNPRPLADKISNFDQLKLGEPAQTRDLHLSLCLDKSLSCAA